MGTFRGVELDGLVLHAGRVDLRPWRGSDVARVHEVMQDERMREFLPDLPRPYTLDDARSYVHDVAGATRRTGSALDCAVVERSSGALIGSCVLRLDREPEIGYWIATDARGHGYAAEATRRLVDWGFGVGVHRIALLCSTRNLSSARTALAAGFAFEGISRDGCTVEAADRAVQGRDPAGNRARFARLATDPGDPIPPSLPPLPDGGLSDGVLALRGTGADDAPSLMQLDDELARFWSFDGRGSSERQAYDAALDAGLHWLVGRTGLRLTMIDVESGSFAGSMTLRLTGPPGVCLIGYTVHPAFRGRGCTSRALALFSSWAFDVAGLARLELGAKIGNIASQRAAHNAGFRFEGTFAGRDRDADGSFHDEARYALLNPTCRRVGAVARAPAQLARRMRP